MYQPLAQIVVLIGGVFVLPNMLFAQRTFSTIVQVFIDLLEFMIPIISILTLLVFMWGAAQFVLNSGEAKGHAAGGQMLLWGVVGLFVALSVWGLVQLIKRTFLG